MKKLVFIDQYLNAGGAERVFCTILRSLDPKKFDISLILISGKGVLLPLVPDHVKVHTLGVSNTRKALQSAIKKLRGLEPETVFCTSSRVAILLVLARLFTKHFKIVARYPSMPSIEIREKKLSGWRLWVTKTFYRRVDRVIAQTDEMADDVVGIFGVKPDQVKVIFNPVDTQFIDDSITESNRDFDLKGINILGVGSVREIKGFDVLIKAFALFGEEHSDAILNIVGKNIDNTTNDLKALCKKLNISSKVQFHGYKENPYKFITHADLFVLSSRYEGLPNVVLEARYLKCNCVATDCVPIIRRLVKDQFIAPVGDHRSLAKAMLDAYAFQGNTYLKVPLTEQSLASQLGFCEDRKL